MEYESRKKVSEWELRHMKEIFEELFKLTQNKEALQEMKQFSEKVNTKYQLGFNYNAFSFRAYRLESFIKVCEVLLERMKKESARVSKAREERERERGRRW